MQQVLGFFHNLTRYGWMIPLVAVVAAATAAVADSVQTPVYRTTARVAVRPVPGLPDTATQVNALVGLNDPAIAGTFARMFTAPAQRTAARQAANVPAGADYPLTARLLDEAPVIEVSVTGSDPDA